MTLEISTVVLAVFAILSSAVSTYVVLYVKKELGPIVQQLNQHDKQLVSRKAVEADIYQRLHQNGTKDADRFAEHGERLSHLEAKVDV